MDEIIWHDQPPHNHVCNFNTMTMNCRGHWTKVRGNWDRVGWLWACSKVGCPTSFVAAEALT